MAHGNGTDAGGADSILSRSASRNFTYEEVSQSLCISANRRVIRPGTSRSIEGKTSKPVAEVKLVHASLPELAPESDFVFSNSIGNDICQVTAVIIPALRRSNSHLFEPRPTRRGEWSNDDIRRSGKGCPSGLFL